MIVYDFTVKDGKGNDVKLDLYKGKVLLIVNTATRCGLTPQYEALETLYKKYHDKGFEILDFPSNQFLNQAPGSDGEIDAFCTLNYHTSFPRFAKIQVNGKDTAPLYAWLKQQITADAGDEKSKSFEKKVRLLNWRSAPGDIKWNFGKFLVDRKGGAVQRYSPAYTPDKLEKDIERYLAEY